MFKGFSFASVVLSCLALPALAQIAPPAAPKPAFADAAPATPKPAIPTLKVGDAAPALAVDNWVKGEAVPKFERGKVYVVEFFATWCLPCKASIPQMTEMQRTNPDLVFICIAGSELLKKGESDTRLQKLSDFVKSQGAAMGYRVGYDSSTSMSNNWLKAAGVRGIPSGFVVNGEGKVAYIGHPLDVPFQDALKTALKDAGTRHASAGTPRGPQLEQPAHTASEPAPAPLTVGEPVEAEVAAPVAATPTP